MSWITSIDLSVLDWIQQHLQCTFLDGFFPVITHLADIGWCWIVLALVLLILPKTRRLGLFLALALVIDSLLCNALVKPLFARIRPYELNDTVTLLVRAPTDYSFPSGHTAVSFAATAALWAGRSKLWIPALVLSILLACSRLYLYLHYPTDVLGGIVLGIAAGILGAQCGKKLLEKEAIHRLVCPNDK